MIEDELMRKLAALKAENARLRAALIAVRNEWHAWYNRMESMSRAFHRMHDIVTDALEGTDDD